MPRSLGVLLLLATATIVGVQAPASATHLSSVTWGAGSNTIARDYENANYGGPVARRTSVKTQCSASGADVDSGGYPGQFNVDEHGTLEQSNWNNDISSYRVYRQCLAVHWDSARCTGSGLVLADYSRPSMGSMNDRTSCIWWT